MTNCGDLKYDPYFLCEWELEVGTKNIKRLSLVDPKTGLLPTLHIKFDLMKQLVIVLPEEGNALIILGSSFLVYLSQVKCRSIMTYERWQL